MLLTTTQVAEKLNISSASVTRLVAKGILIPTNARKPDTKRFNARFDSKHINEAAKTIAVRPRRGKSGRAVIQPLLRADANGSHGNTPLVLPPHVTSPLGIMSRLERLEAKVDELLALWR